MGALTTARDPFESVQAPLPTKQTSRVPDKCDCGKLWLCLAEGDKDCSELNAALGEREGHYCGFLDATLLLYEDAQRKWW